MKKIILSAAILLGSVNAFATTNSDEKRIALEVLVVNKYTEIAISKVPTAVTDALKTAYPDAILNKAYVNEKKEYRLDVKVGDKEGSLFTDENGNWIQGE